jgi:hypothetical protein
LEDTIRNKEARMEVDYREGASIRYRDFAGREYEIPQAGRRIAIQSRDAEGNWTRKTTVERNPASGDDVVVASMDRTITYHSD